MRQRCFQTDTGQVAQCFFFRSEFTFLGMDSASDDLQPPRQWDERAQPIREIPASEARLDATAVGHEVGQRTTLDLLNAETDRAGAGLALAQARVGLWLDRLRLAMLAGQLDETLLRTADADLVPAAGH